MSKKKASEKTITAEVVTAMPQLTSSLFDVKMNQGDMVNYVISREVEKLENQLEPLKAQHKIESEKLKTIKASFKQKVIDLATKQLETVLKALKASKAEYELVAESKNDPYLWQNVVASFFHENVNRRNNNELNYVLNQKNVLLIKSNGSFVAALEYAIDDKTFKSLVAEEKTQLEVVATLEKETHVIVDRINETKRNSDKIKNKLIEQFLNSSDEGVQVLKKLQDIQFTGKLLKA